MLLCLRTDHSSLHNILLAKPDAHIWGGSEAHGALLEAGGRFSNTRSSDYDEPPWWRDLSSNPFYSKDPLSHFFWST
eukprot:233492-Pelagomonas_calceolata.AAC.1